MTALLPQITIPTLIFSGGNDLCTPYIAKTMADRIPNAQWTLFRESRHMCYVEENDAYCADILTQSAAVSASLAPSG